MSIQGNPFIIHDSSLVLSLDAANIKSFRGEPTTNVVPNPLDLFAWCINGANSATLSRDTSSLASPAGGIPMRMTTTGSDPYTSTYNAAFNLSAASQGQVWTMSVWAKANRSLTCELFLFEANSSGVYINLSTVSINVTTEWQRFTLSRTNSEATVAYVQVRLDGPNTYSAGDIVWWDGLQVEQKAYATTFVSGSRGTSVETGGGLYDLTNGNNNGTLTNGPTFNSANGGSIVFDGSDDEIFIDNSSSINFIGTQRYTALIWVYPNLGGTTWHGIVSKGNAQQYALTINSPNAFLHYETNQGGIGALNSAYDSIDLNKWQQVGIGFDGSTKTIWKNGISIASQIASTLNSSTNTEQLRIGEGNDGEQFRGNIAQVSIYNKALSASEVLQNYNSAKSRFGL